MEGVGFRVAYLVDAWSGSLMLGVAGFGFLVSVAEGDGENPKPGIVNHRGSRIINHAPVGQLMAEGPAWSGDKLILGFRVAYPVEVRVTHPVTGLRFRVACLLDVWSGGV